MLFLPNRNFEFVDALVQLCRAGIVFWIVGNLVHRGVVAQIGVRRIVEQCHELVVLFVFEWLVGMAMTLHTAKRHALPRLPSPCSHGRGLPRYGTPHRQCRPRRWFG